MCTSSGLQTYKWPSQTAALDLIVQEYSRETKGTVQFEKVEKLFNISLFSSFDFAKVLPLLRTGIEIFNYRLKSFPIAGITMHKKFNLVWVAVRLSWYTLVSANQTQTLIVLLLCWKVYFSTAYNVWITKEHLVKWEEVFEIYYP